MENIPQPVCLFENVWLVPCILNRDSDSFLALFKPFSNTIHFETQFRNSWQDTEDLTLKTLVEKFGIKHWKKVCNELNKLVYKGMPLRNSKQCRERWLNHLNPDLNKSKWTDAEDLFILENQMEIGNKWSEIARKMNGRTENSVKNRWKCLCTKAKKIFPGFTNPIEEFIRRRKSGESAAGIKQSQRIANGFVPRSTYQDIAFSTLANKFRNAYVPQKSPGIQDISPSSLLFFNS